MVEFKCKAILFDLDGVLVDSSVCIERHWREWAEKNNLDMQAIMRVHAGRRTEETIRAVAPHLKAEAEAARFAENEAVDTEGVIEIPGAADLLRSLPAGSWAVVTSGPQKSSRARMKRAGLPLPAVLVTAEDVLRGKPDPEPYQLAAARLGFAPADCIVVEDAPAGIQAGRAAGSRVIAVAFSHPTEELTGAQEIAAQLSDIQISVAVQSSVTLSVRINSV